MQNKDSIKNTLLIGIGLCLICAAVISVIAVGLKELQKSILSDYIDFSQSRDPSDIAESIEKNIKNKILHPNRKEFIKVIIEKYQNQTRTLKKWLG